MVGCALCGREISGEKGSTCRSMQDRLSVSEDGFTYLHAVLNILSAAECYDGELSVDGLLCDSCADSLEQLEQLQNQVRYLVEFLLTGYQQRSRYTRAVIEEEVRIARGHKNGPNSKEKKDCSSLSSVIEDSGGTKGDPWPAISTATADCSDEDSGPPLIECETRLTVRRGRGRGRGGRRGRGGGGRGGAGVVIRRSSNKKRPKVSCGVCAEQFATSLSLRRHLEEQHGEAALPNVNICDICQYRLKSKRMLARHKFTVHGVEVPYTCPTCKAVLKSEAEYSQHSRELHSAVAVCELCGKECSSRLDRYICEVCSKICKSKGSLRVHMRRHSTVNSVQCQMCERSFKWESSLNSHIQAAHHPTGPKFPCDLCDRVFKDKNNQKKHRFTHSNVKPFQCDDCGKGFIRRDFFNKHRCSGNPLLGCDEK